jgi:hypothetical protein
MGRAAAPAALAFLIALFQVIAALFVWIELLVRDAAILRRGAVLPGCARGRDLAVAAPVGVRRLSLLLLMFVILKPVILIVLALAGNAAMPGLSFGYGAALQSVGTILFGVVICPIAAFSPATLMFLLGTEVGAMRGSRAGSGSATGSGDIHASDPADVTGAPIGGELDPGMAIAAEPELAATASGGGTGSRTVRPAAAPEPPVDAGGPLLGPEQDRNATAYEALGRDANADPNADARRARVMLVDAASLALSAWLEPVLLTLAGEADKGVPGDRGRLTTLYRSRPRSHDLGGPSTQLSPGRISTRSCPTSQHPLAAIGWR